MSTWTGTSGFQYPEWKGGFYPEKLAAAGMLRFYASVFNSTESNYTFRSVPTEKTIARWMAETPEAFRFSLKAPQRVTHFAKLKDCGGAMRDFHAAVKGLGPKLGPVLIQLPPTFKADAARLRDFLQSLPAGLRAAFEFRHESWLTDETYTVLRESNAALCLAESEDFTVPREATADFGYLRLRRADYSNAALADWAHEVRRHHQAGQWRETFVYFKHEETGTGPRFAGRFAELLAAG